MALGGKKSHTCARIIHLHVLAGYSILSDCGASSEQSEVGVGVGVAGSVVSLHRRTLQWSRVLCHHLLLGV